MKKIIIILLILLYILNCKKPVTAPDNITNPSNTNENPTDPEEPNPPTYTLEKLLQEYEGVYGQTNINIQTVSTYISRYKIKNTKLYEMAYSLKRWEKNEITNLILEGTNVIKYLYNNNPKKYITITLTTINQNKYLTYKYEDGSGDSLTKYDFPEDKYKGIYERESQGNGERLEIDEYGNIILTPLKFPTLESDIITRLCVLDKNKLLYYNDPQKYPASYFIFENDGTVTYIKQTTYTNTNTFTKKK